MKFQRIAKLEYNADLRKCDVDAVLEWTKKSNLPILTEFQVQLFLKVSEWHIEEAKRRISGFVSMKIRKESIRYADLENTFFQNALETTLQTILPIRAGGKNQRLFFMKMINPDVELFNYTYHLKLIDIVAILDLYKYGESPKFTVVIDNSGSTLGHLSGFNLSHLKEFAVYSQKYCPCRIEAIHVINANALMEKLLTLVTPLLDSDFLRMVKIHTTNWKETLPVFIDLVNFPSDYGGSGPSVDQLHDEMVKTVHENYYIIDEIRAQLGPPEREFDEFESDGSFKKLEID